MAELGWNPGMRRTRRLHRGDGSWPDLRRTFRNSLQYGGEVVELAHLERRDKPRSLVLICDVSGSMERYTRLLLHFIHTIAANLGKSGVLPVCHPVDPHHEAPALPEHRPGRDRGLPGCPRLGRRNAHRREYPQLQLPVGPAGAAWRIGGADHFRWMGPGRAGATVKGDVPPPEELPPADLAEPPAGPR